MCQLYRGVCHVVRGMHTLNVSIASLFELHFTTRTRMVLNWTLGGRPKCSTEYSNETFSCYYIFDWERLQLKNTNKRTADTLRFISSGGNACAHWFYMYICCFSTFFFYMMSLAYSQRQMFKVQETHKSGNSRPAPLFCESRRNWEAGTLSRGDCISVLQVFSRYFCVESLLFIFTKSLAIRWSLRFIGILHLLVLLHRFYPLAFRMYNTWFYGINSGINSWRSAF